MITSLELEWGQIISVLLRWGNLYWYGHSLYCRAQRSGARLGNRDVVYTVLQSRPPGAPHKFGTRDLHLLLGVSKYVGDRARYF